MGHYINTIKTCERMCHRNIRTLDWCSLFINSLATSSVYNYILTITTDIAIRYQMTCSGKITITISRLACTLNFIYCLLKWYVH